jgi:nucleoside-diphosphate-sugar epimerase
MSALVCMIGASGFVGNRTLQRVSATARVLVHRRPVQQSTQIESIPGDAADPAVLDRLLEPDAVVLNFAYGGEASGERLAAALAAACARRGVRRLVHLSTCSVYGAAPGVLVDEETPCEPVAPYERTKHAVESILTRHAGPYELAILRPTAVFGPQGKNLETLALRVLRQPWPRRYLRACAMGARRMHAVDVECVAAAALFLVDTPMMAKVERFIVSQDDEPANNYADIEAFLARCLSAEPYPVPPIRWPAGALGLALRLAGRSNVEPRRRYSAAKLASRGFAAPRPFALALEEYAAWVESRARP